MKKKFEIPVTRIGYSYKTITVEANSQEEAEEIALDTAGDEEFSEREPSGLGGTAIMDTSDGTSSFSTE